MKSLEILVHEKDQVDHETTQSYDLGKGLSWTRRQSEWRIGRRTTRPLWKDKERRKGSSIKGPGGPLSRLDSVPPSRSFLTIPDEKGFVKPTATSESNQMIEIATERKQKVLSVFPRRVGSQQECIKNLFINLTEKKRGGIV